MVVFPGKTGRKGHYCISARSGTVRVPDIGESVVVGLAPGSGRVGWRQSPVLKGRLGVRDADLVGPGKFYPVVVGVKTPVFNFAVVVCPGFAKEVATSCIRLGFGHFGIGCAVVVGVRPQLQGNIGEAGLPGILDTIVVAVLPDQVADFNQGSCGVSVNIPQSDAFTEGECVVSGILVQLVGQSRRTV